MVGHSFSVNVTQEFFSGIIFRVQSDWLKARINELPHLSCMLTLRSNLHTASLIPAYSSLFPLVQLLCSLIGLCYLLCVDKHMTLEVTSMILIFEDRSRLYLSSWYFNKMPMIFEMVPYFEDGSNPKTWLMNGETSTYVDNNTSVKVTLTFLDCLVYNII